MAHPDHLTKAAPTNKEAGSKKSPDAGSGGLRRGSRYLLSPSDLETLQTWRTTVLSMLVHLPHHVEKLEGDAEGGL
jgi:hypothetical protein